MTLNPRDLKDHYGPLVRVRAYRYQIINAVYLVIAKI